MRFRKKENVTNLSLRFCRENDPGFGYTVKWCDVFIHLCCFNKICKPGLLRMDRNTLAPGSRHREVQEWLQLLATAFFPHYPMTEGQKGRDKEPIKTWLLSSNNINPLVKAHLGPTPQYFYRYVWPYGQIFVKGSESKWWMTLPHLRILLFIYNYHFKNMVRKTNIFYFTLL